MKLLAKVSRQLTRIFPARPFKIGGSQSVVSFTFDDIPVSSSTTGAGILEASSVLGTFYVCTGQISGVLDGNLIANDKDVVRLAKAGHEIGCHTVSHASVQAISAMDREREFAENSRSIERITGLRPCSFSFPYGHAGPVSRQHALKHYLSARSVVPGSNHGWCDLGYLKANAVYHNSYDLDAVRVLLDACRNHPHWVIFYTHDVSDRPSEWGCTPQELESIVRLAKASNARILPVKQAIAWFGYHSLLTQKNVTSVNA
ncbi:MAG: polysaccharide deacetylase family protein [Planctomycetota bacterium]|nr:polysaccharide deacetylase family protein [Planctomycetota bacterium]